LAGMANSGNCTILNMLLSILEICGNTTFEATTKVLGSAETGCRLSQSTGGLTQRMLHGIILQQKFNIRVLLEIIYMSSKLVDRLGRNMSQNRCR
jgi:hypothetical protein